MKKILVLCLLTFLFFIQETHAQEISLDDSTIVFKNPEGKELSRADAQKLMKEKFSLKEEQVNGRKVVTIYPARVDMEEMNRKIEALRQNLLNKPIGDFVLTDMDKKVWDAKELKGKVVVINFWFTRCKPCIQEMPYLNELVKSNKKKSVVFLAPAPEDEATLKDFLDRFDFDYRVIPSSRDFIREKSVEAFPTHLIIDKEGVIRQVIIGYSKDVGTMIQKELDELVRK